MAWWFLLVQVGLSLQLEVDIVYEVGYPELLLADYLAL